MRGVAKVPRGVKVSEFPAEQPMRFELDINLKNGEGHPSRPDKTIK